MKIYTLTSTQQLPISRKEAWTFFSDPRQLASITPDDMSFEMMDDMTEPMHAGMILSYRIRPFPLIQVQWVTEITHVIEGERFVDEQRLGPFRFWHHQHRFTEINGGVEMQDTVHYAMPFSIFGRLVHKLLVRKRLEEIFSFRKKQLQAYFGHRQDDNTQ
ncbi:ligand-binding SRPBCC domain-containing protein [Geomicrobium halophilum]|uniref:Ligand-binding SRPBCC domain-containing protein n=1 Tax=Geomicrobium halophilum TaxID=549000 RepID=A0A841PZ60_9BACL|nr:SRPBCC family protein [Geomicrobium halophilum]MBB6449645.1 ligand-binding SRPBCC domain-containing protein [Geomicrobium halophilum]